MNSSSPQRGFPAGNPIANALVIVVGALAIGASLVLGFFAFVILASVVLVFSAIVALRLWWFNRKFRKAAAQARSSAQSPRTSPTVEVIEGEYRVIVKDKDTRGP